MCVLAALILWWIADAPVRNSRVSEEHVRAVARTSAEFSMFQESPLRIVIGAHQRVHAAIENPVHRFAGNISLGGRSAKGRNQEPAMPLFLNWITHIRKIEHGQTHQLK